MTQKTLQPGGGKQCRGRGWEESCGELSCRHGMLGCWTYEIIVPGVICTWRSSQNSNIDEHQAQRHPVTSNNWQVLGRGESLWSAATGRVLKRHWMVAHPCPYKQHYMNSISEEGGRRRKKREKEKIHDFGRGTYWWKNVDTGEILSVRYGNILLITYMKLKRTNKVTKWFKHCGTTNCIKQLS